MKYILQKTVILALTITKLEATTYDRQNLGITDLTTESIPSNAVTAVYNYNNLQMIPANLLLSANLPSLLRLRFNYNQINSVANGAFMHLITLDELFLEHSNFKILTRDMLKGCFNLRILYITNNPLHTIEDGALWDTTNLQTVRMYYNDLTTFPELAFNPDNLPAAINNLFLYGM